MKKTSACYLKVTATFASLICLLFSTIKTNAQWIELGGTKSSFNYSIMCLTNDKSGNIYAAGFFTNGSGKKYVAQWNGSSWVELGGTNTSTFNSIILSLATDASGNVYAAGAFTDGIGKPYVAKWNGSSWIELGGKDSSTFNETINSITTDSIDNVYAAGNFTNENNSQFVAKWNGNSWAELGGTNNSHFGVINSLTTDLNNNVYAAGESVNGNSKYYVAKWNGISWVEVGGTNNSTFNGFINSITTDANSNVYATGDFTDENNSRYVAKWNGSSWVELGGTDSSFFGSYLYSDLSTDSKGNVYAATKYVFEWNGSSWVQLGGINSPKFNNNINSITTDANGTVYAAGNFTDSNGKYYVAEYNPNSLPITLSSINAKQQNRDIAINWHTSTELNTSHFIIQHSTDGSSFSDIGTVKAIGNGANSYNFTDTHPANGINYYRLESVDKDGAVSYSKVVSVQFTVNSNQLTVYPNPAKSSVTVRGSHIASVQVIDNMGRVVKVVSLKDATNPVLSVSGLGAGVYHLRIQTTDGGVSGAGFVKE